MPQPLPVYTTEEIGQVAHAVDELHTQALLLAGDEARLRLLVNDMFETMSRRSRSLVDQQLSLIDRLERNEEDPERLDSLFRLDHLAARLRRNSANLLVLAGAQLARDQRDPVPLATVINAAVSEVEDYRRVEIAGLPDSSALVGAAAGGAIHLFAELIDNALRYSPPATPVRVSAVPRRRRGSRGADRRRRAGHERRRSAHRQHAAAGRRRRQPRQRPPHGSVRGRPDRGPARHPGGAAWPGGQRVGLGHHRRDLPAANGARRVRRGRAREPRARIRAVSSPSAQARRSIAAPAGRDPGEATASPSRRPRTPPDAAAPPVTLLPRRNPGSSGITEVPAAPAEQQPRRHRRELPTPWWESATPATPADPGRPSRSPRRRGGVGHVGVLRRAVAGGRRAGDAVGPERARPVDVRPARKTAAATPADDDVIYRRMLSEMLGDPHDLVNSPDLDWQSVWDRGWTLAAAAEDKPVESRTAEHGLPVRTPGARLVPGAANGTGLTERSEPEPASTADRLHREPQHAAAARDPEAVRASFSSHFGGVRTGTVARPRHETQGPDQE